MTNDDDELDGLSVENKLFVELMDSKVSTTLDGNLQAPLPLKQEILPNNKAAVFHRTKNTLRRMISSEPNEFAKCQKIIRKYLDRKEIERVPVEELMKEDGKLYYLNIFKVKNPLKDDPRLVFDAAAQYDGFSLNDYLLAGPDYTNELRGVIIRFREGIYYNYKN